MRRSGEADKTLTEPRDFVPETLWTDGEMVLSRTVRNGERLLFIAPAKPHPDPSSIRRLERAYSIREKLPKVVSTRPLELVSFRNQPALVLEDPGGEVLAGIIGIRWETSAFLRVALGLACAIAEFRASGLLHNDIRPANILADVLTGRVWLTGLGKITEIGISSRPRPEPNEPVPDALPYMAPEQTGRINLPVDERSDLYSAGIILYQMFTGQSPFPAADPLGWIHSQLARVPVTPTELVSDIPDVLSRIVMKLLAKRPEDRYQTALGLAVDLTRCCEEWNGAGAITPFPLAQNEAPGRLVIRENLYGRDKELEILKAAATRVTSTGAAELILVSGYSGVGKSSLVNELRRELTGGCLFALGKFDQYKRDVPYSTLTQSFETLLRQILSGSDVEIDRWKSDLREAVEPNGTLVADLVPELKFVLGTLPPVPELPPQDAKNRFHRVLQRFLAVFARPEHPLVLFLDDLQWVDRATLELLRHLAVTGEVQHLLLIGAYRDNEIDSSHPLTQTLAAVKREGIEIRNVALAPLAFGDLAQLVCDSLRIDSERAHPLIELLHEKTRGNPFFAIQFLRELADDGLIVFNSREQSWQWDSDRIHAKNFTDNVVTFMEGRLGRLSAGAQETLKIFACLGHSARTVTLAMAQAVSEEETQTSLSVAVREGLIVRNGDRYTFLHDRVQEAAYERVPPDERAGEHLRIGRRLVKHLSEEDVFEVVNQLNQGIALITSPEERKHLAEMNFVAGRRSISSTAYGSAQSYLSMAAALLDEASWEHSYSLALGIELHRAQCEFLTGESADADRRLAALSQRAKGTVDHSEVACLHIEICTATGRSDHAIEICLGYLRRVGIAWTIHPPKEQFAQEYEQFQRNLAGRPLEALIDLPPMNDPVQRATLNVLSAVGAAAFFTDENLLNLTLCRTANISLMHGNDESSPLAYTYLGSLLGPHFGDYKSGYRLGKLGIDLVERGLDRWRCRVYVCFGTLINPWSKHVRASFGWIRQAFESALEVGDLGYAGYCCQNLIPLLIANGTLLAEVQSEALERLEFARKIKFGLVIDSLTGQLALVRQLRGLTRDFSCFDDGDFEERAFERHLEADPLLAFAACWYWIRKLQGRFYAGDHAGALEAAAKAEPLLWTSPSFFEIAEYHFFSALSQAALCPRADENERRRRLQAIEAHQVQLERWAKNCPENFANRTALVAAETARIEERELEAERLYEESIRFARDNGFVHHEALACELAGAFHHQRGFEIISHAYLERARRGYSVWGAEGKVRQLERSRDSLDVYSGGDTPLTARGGLVEKLDLATVIKMSHAASEEIVLEQLIERLMVSTIEYAAAERGLLLIYRGGRLRIAAQGTTRNDKVVVDLRDNEAASQDLPISVVNYVVRTTETLLLDDASLANPFSADEYLARTGSRSLLCLPLLKQGSLIGILFIENRLVSHAFSRAQVEVLRLVSSQAAISLENASLYSELHRSEAYLARAQQLSNTGSFGWRPATSELVWSEQTFRILGFDAATRPDIDRARERVHPEDGDFVARVLEEAVRAEAPFDFEARLRMPDGEIKHIRCIAKPVRDETGKHCEFIGALRDISAEKLAENSLRKVQAELVEASERERRNVGRDLHDGLGQRLTALALMSDALCESAIATRERKSNARAMVESARQLSVYLREAIGETRRLAHGLSPVPFASDGLTSALKALVESVDGMRGVRAEFHCGEPVAFDESAVTEHLYRIVQEALNNALKHSSATLIRVTVCKRGNSVEISITDNGIGLSKARPEVSGMGLRTMSYRANLVGGKLVATEGPNGGAVLTCTLPLAPSSAQ